MYVVTSRPARHDGGMKNLSDLQPAIRVVMMPCDTNPLGTIFGGVILSYIDQAAAVEAYRHSEKMLVTVALHEVKFIAPVYVGDLVSFYTELIKIGTTSVTVRPADRKSPTPLNRNTSRPDPPTRVSAPASPMSVSSPPRPSIPPRRGSSTRP